MAEIEESSKSPNNEPKNEAVPGVPEESDPGVDKAVDDIVRSEGDDELKAQDEAAAKAIVMKLSPWERFKNAQRNWWGNPRKKWSTIAILIIIVAGLAAIPFIRYNIAGLFVHEKVTVEAIDSKTGKPVSGAEIEIGGLRAETDGEGLAVLYPHAGSKHLLASKNYYSGSTQTILVTLSPNKNVFKARLVALGRLVSVKVVNTITNAPLENAEIVAGTTTAKTNSNGLADVILPSSASTQSASIDLSGYNTAQTTITASGDLSKNTFAITPTGKLYFLSNLSGTIDVVKTNLDGTDRQTVLAGTGDEDPNDTSLLASRDWKYLALLSRRSGSTASLYLIDTTNGDKLTTIDEGNATFSPVGWSGDRFIYLVDRSNTVSDWQSDQVALKSFNPSTGQLLSLDQTQASGTSETNYAKQDFSDVYLIGNQVVYTKSWEGNGLDALNGKQAELDSIGPDGSDSRVVKTFTPSSYATNSFGYTQISLTARLYEPDELYMDFSGNDTDSFYEYVDGNVNPTTDVTSDSFYASTYPTYLLSPSGNSTFWAEPRDGQNTLFVGDQNGDNQKQVANLSPYSAYGWYTDSYLLLSQNSSELYIMPATGGTPLKITDYYKPPINYNDYGGGYGGL